MQTLPINQNASCKPLDEVHLVQGLAQSAHIPPLGLGGDGGASGAGVSDGGGVGCGGGGGFGLPDPSPGVGGVEGC